MSELSQATQSSSLVRRLLAPFARAHNYAQFDHAGHAASASNPSQQPQQQQSQQPGQKRALRYSGVSSGGHRFVLGGASHVTSPTSPGVFGALASQGSHSPAKSSARHQQRRQSWNHVKHRNRLIRQLRTELGKADVNGFLPASYASNAMDNYELDENLERGNWSGRLDFLLSCLGYAVGLGNVWRFPYLCFVNGGGAFLVPYTVFLLLCGIPVFLLDVSLGQFTSEGPSTCWEFAPLFSGIGHAMVYLSTLVSIYYNMIIAYSIYYLFASMSSQLPWSTCANAWNTATCSHRIPVVECSPGHQQLNGTCFNGTQFLGVFNETLFNQMTGLYRFLPADEYYNNQVLKRSATIEAFGTPDWKLTLCLLTSWLMVFCCLVKGIKSSGKVVYFTALFPYVVLTILFFRGITLSHALDGIRFYIVPDFRKLASSGVWIDAAGQIFFSLSCSWGGMISLASYNRFHNNVIRDTLFVTLANCFTSFFAGFVIFSFIGHLAWKLGVEVKDVTRSGFGLAYVIYPEALTLLPGSSFWSVLFFVMILTLGVDSQFAMVETLTTSLCDLFHCLRRRKPALLACVCFTLFLLGLPFCCPGGQYLMEIVDNYGGSWAVLMIGFFECIAFGWIYGRPGCGKFHRFSSDIGLMMQKPISPLWRYLWQYVSPLLIFGIILFNWLSYSRTEYVKGSGRFLPGWADVLGWLITLTAVVIILGVGLWKLAREPAGTPWGLRFLLLSIPSYKWGPALPRHRLLMAPYLERLGALPHFYLHPAKLIKYCDVFPSGKPEVRTPDDSVAVSQAHQPSETTIHPAFLEVELGTGGAANPGENWTEV